MVKTVNWHPQVDDKIRFFHRDKWKVKSFRRDPDNISAAAKFLMDGLVEGNIIQDDSLKFIISPVLHWYEKGDNLAEVRVADHPIWNGNHISLVIGAGQSL